MSKKVFRLPYVTFKGGFRKCARRCPIGQSTGEFLKNSDNHSTMPSESEILQNLLVTGCRKRPAGTRQRICIYLDVRLLQEAKQYKICERRSRSISLSQWIERQLASAIQNEKASQ